MTAPRSSPSEGLTQAKQSSERSSTEPSLEIDVEISDTPNDVEAVFPRADEARRSIVGHMISDRYRVDELIAEGGMGAVYRGEHVHMRKLVAIKVLRPETEGFPELVTRFEREAIAGAHIDHPNVASATDFGRLGDGSYFLILEYVDGMTLRQRMKNGPVPFAETCRIVRELAQALGACHRMRVVHRDVKPRNVMIETATSRVKLIDFGLAKVPARPSIAPPKDNADEDDTRRSITLKGIVFGTVAYLAPEAEFGMDAIDHRADLYALGIVLYELCTGKHPFEATEPSALFFCHKAVPPPPMRLRAPDRAVSPALEAIAMRLLAKKPSDRYADADAVVAAVDAALASSITAEITLEPVMAREATARSSSLVTPPLGVAAVASSPRRGHARFWIAALVGGGLLAGAAQMTPRARTDQVTARFGETALFAAEAASTRVARERAETAASVETAKQKMRDAADAHHFAAGAAALLDLATLAGEKPGFEARDVTAATSIALGLGFSGDPNFETVFQALAERLGPDGIDVLYDISSKHGGARAARRADALLATASVHDHATPEVRAALSLRDATCDDKPQLFDEVSRNGDERTLMLLERLRGLKCSASRCCYAHDAALDASIAHMKARLAK